MSLNGKTAIITGSTSGIGKGIAESLAKAGANIVLNGFGDVKEIEAQRLKLAKDNDVEVLYHDADMTKPKEIEDLVTKTADHFGSIDIIVNNAGIQHVSPVQDFPDEKWDQIIAINLSSGFHMIKHSVPHMKNSGWGRIINLVSAHGLVASPYKVGYVATKHGMIGVTKTIALELAKENITCNAICPGYVNTPLVDNQIKDTAKARNMDEDKVIEEVILAAEPTKKFTTVEDIGAFCVFLCSDTAANITGASLTMDGGWTAQ